jgi:hypothetical protein
MGVWCGCRAPIAGFIGWMDSGRRDAEASMGIDLRRFPKKAARCTTQRAENDALLATSAPTWPHHTDTLGLSACLRFECVDVLTQEVEGGLQDHVLHRIERQNARSFALKACLLERVVGF